MEAILEICCGLDVHRDKIVACLMKGPLDCKPMVEIRTFSALQHDLKKLKKWLGKEDCHDKVIGACHQLINNSVLAYGYLIAMLIQIILIIPFLSMSSSGATHR